MRTERAVAVAELVLYAVALWASLEMSKTDDQRLRDRLNRYQRCARASWWLAYQLGQIGLRAELAYLRETL